MSGDIGGSSLEALLQRSEELTAGLHGGADLPRVKRNLNQVLDAGKRLWSKTAAHGTDSQQVKAALLLGQKGIEIGEVPERLKNLNTTRNLEPLEPVQHTDIEGFLKNEHENAILAVIAEQKQKTFDEVTNRHWETRLSEWDKEKTRILSTLLGSDDRLNIGIMQNKQKRRTIDQNATFDNKRSMLDENELLYSQQVHKYTKLSVQGGYSGSLVELCSEAAERMSNQTLLAIWQMVSDMTKEIKLSPGLSPIQQRLNPDVQHQMINSARNHLESNYYKFIQETVNANLREAQRGGIPGTEQLVSSFLNVRKVNLRTYEDGEIWAMLYYCLRCGQIKAAVEIARKNSQKIGDFYPCLLEWTESPIRMLGPTQEAKLKIQYRRSVRTSTDPFKRAVYSIVGKCDTDIHQDVIEKTDDYLWLKLSQVIIGESKDGYETYQKFQQVLLEEYGEAHFQAEQSPMLYFQVLFLSGQLEAAIEFLSRSEVLRCHAVHIAICLYEVGLLLVPSTLHAKLLTREDGDPAPFRRLNFARLIMTFTRKFEQSDPQEALQYFYFLKDIKNVEGCDLFMQCVSQLVRDSREFSTLLGRMEPGTGVRRPGAIDKFFGDTTKIILKIAADCEEKGLFEDAISLYDLGRNYNKVVSLLSTTLSQVLSEADKHQSDRNRMKSRAQEIAWRYRDQAVDVDRSAAETFHIILDLMNYFDMYHAREYDQALDVIRQIDLLPLNVVPGSSQREFIQQKVSKLGHYSEEIRRSLSEILLSVMNILLQKYKNIQSNNKRNVADQSQTQSQLSEIKNLAKCLINFAGMVPYRLPGDTNMRLVQYEVKMN